MMDRFDIADPFTLCEWWRTTTLAALVALNRDPVTTSYSGVGLIAWDDACGQLVVTPERVFRYQTFPVEQTDADVCGSDSIAVSLLVSLVRCMPTLSDSGNPPSAAEIGTASQNALVDASIVWNVVSGGMPSENWERGLINQTFVGSEGGAVVSETRFTIGLPEDIWCVT